LEKLNMKTGSVNNSQKRNNSLSFVTKMTGVSSLRRL
jgi:hypothetical protein